MTKKTLLSMFGAAALAAGSVFNSQAETNSVPLPPKMLSAPEFVPYQTTNKQVRLFLELYSTGVYSVVSSTNGLTYSPENSRFGTNTFVVAGSTNEFPKQQAWISAPISPADFDAVRAKLYGAKKHEN